MRLLIAIVLLLSLLPLQPALAQAVYYRYTNEQGVKVIDDNIPPEFVKNGYDVLAADGRVLREVPRELTEEERRLQNTAEARKRTAKKEQAQQQAWDESLLRRYSTVADIDAAEERAIRNLNIRISILKSNVTSLKQQIGNLQARAADAERRGLEVPATIADNIEALREEMADTEESVAARNREVAEVKASFQRDKDRFEQLQDRAAMRSRAGQSADQDQDSTY